MTEFFVKTDDSSAGPFTGVELREAALARIIDPDSEIGASPTGPWTPAGQAGLFSSQRIPLPHPEGTHVPDFAVRGFAGGSGRLKLRELIGFAARGMLSPRVTLQSDVSDEWIPINRLPVLVACLSGQLVLLGESGKIHLRSGQHADDAGNEIDEVVHAPVEIAPAVDMASLSAPQDSDARKTWVAGDEGLIFDEDEAETEAVGQEDSPSDQSDVDETNGGREPVSPTFSLPQLGKLRSRFVVNIACVLLVMTGIGVAYSYWRSPAMAQDLVIGDWIGDGEGLPAFGISLRKDGTCVVFNSQGESWTGDYLWGERFDPKSTEEGSESSPARVDDFDPAFEKGPVLPTDGYVRFQGFIQSRPFVGGHPISDCFLRRDGDKLMLGYLTTSSYTASDQRLNAGWTVMRPLKSNSDHVVADLAAVDSEPRSVSELADGNTPHLSQAIVNLQDWQEDDLVDGDVDNGSLCYAKAVNAEYLLKNFGIPDEARAIYPFEDPELASGPLENSQIARYGALSLYLTTTGEIQYVSLTP